MSRLSNALIRTIALGARRTISYTSSTKSSPLPLSRPGPPRLSAKEQREFEDLVKSAATPAAATAAVAGSAPDTSRPIDKPGGDQLHPDAPRQPQSDFVGEVNPVTGEQGGPKREPLRPNSSDWSFGGRVTDF